MLLSANGKGTYCKMAVIKDHAFPKQHIAEYEERKAGLEQDAKLIE